MNIQPLNNQVLIKKIELEEKTKSGIILKSDLPKPQVFAEVLAIASNVVGLSIGDKIVIREFSGMQLELEGKQLLLIHEKDILAIINN